MIVQDLLSTVDPVAPEEFVAPEKVGDIEFSAFNEHVKTLVGYDVLEARALAKQAEERASLAKQVEELNAQKAQFSYANPHSETIDKLFKRGLGADAAADYLRRQSTDWSVATHEERIAAQLQEELSWPKEKALELIEQTYGKEGERTAQQEFALITRSKEALAELVSKQTALPAQMVNVAQQQEAMEKAAEGWKNYVEKVVAATNDLPAGVKDGELEIPFSYKLSEEDKNAVKAAVHRYAVDADINGAFDEKSAEQIKESVAQFTKQVIFAINGPKIVELATRNAYAMGVAEEKRRAAGLPPKEAKAPEGEGGGPKVLSPLHISRIPGLNPQR